MCPHRRLLFCVCLMLTLAACAGVSEDVTSIRDVRHVEHGGLSYRIMENADKHTITTTPSLGASIKGGLINGLALGMANVLPGKEAHLQAARAYLDATGRSHCLIKSAKLVVEPRYRFLYECPGNDDSGVEDGSTAADKRDQLREKSRSISLNLSST